MSKSPRPISAIEAKAERVAVVAAKSFVLLIILYLIVMLATGGFRAEQIAQQNAGVVTNSWLQGSWVRAPAGGEDGATPCADFNERVRYQQNRNTGQLISFAATGEYRALFAYSTPNENEHRTLTKARWQLTGDQLAFSNVVVRDASTGAGEPFAVTVRQLEMNVLEWRSEDGVSRFVRCQGEPSAIYGE